MEYEDLLSGDYIFVKGIGHFRSPQLKEMRPATGIGWQNYTAFIYFLKMSRAELAEIMKETDPSKDMFDIIIDDENMRELYVQAFDFFMLEKLVYNEEHHCMMAMAKDKENNVKVVGVINQTNFDDARIAVLTLNYVTIASTDINTKHSSAASRSAWNRVQEYMNKQKAKSKNNEKLSIGNLISKLCSIHPSINYTNVYELTVFQLYDTFFQTSYMRSIDFSESVVATHGSKNFDYSDWMKPVKNF